MQLQSSGQDVIALMMKSTKLEKFIDSAELMISDLKSEIIFLRSEIKKSGIFSREEMKFWENNMEAT